MTDEPIRLSTSDLGLIHALGYLSRPPITVDVDKTIIIVDMMEKFLLHATRSSWILKPLIGLAERFTSYAPIRPGYYGSLHDDAARVMNTFDALRLGQAWDRLQASDPTGGQS